MDGNGYLEELIVRYPAFAPLKTEIQAAYELLEASYRSGGKLLMAGSGGSCADAKHIVGELVKGFVKGRPLPDDLQEKLKPIGGEKGEKLASGLQEVLPAIALTSHPDLAIAFLSNVDGEMMYAQQVRGYGREGDVFLGISTSGNTKNIEYAYMTARAKGMKVIDLIGRDGGCLKANSDVAIVVPGQETSKIQKLHLPIYHALCLMLEVRFSVSQTLEKDEQ